MCTKGCLLAVLAELKGINDMTAAMWTIHRPPLVHRFHDVCFFVCSNKDHGEVCGVSVAVKLTPSAEASSFFSSLSTTNSILVFCIGVNRKSWALANNTITVCIDRYHFWWEKTCFVPDVKSDVKTCGRCQKCASVHTKILEKVPGFHKTA